MGSIMDIKVFGHQSPDTDTTVSALVWAWYCNNHRDQSATAFVLGDINNEVRYVLDYWQVKPPAILTSVSSDDTVAIVDTNNRDELFDNINDANILTIIDHHKLTGGLQTDEPKEIIIQPYASTITVMFTIMNLEVTEFPREIAGLMLSGILSDTINLTSPTTTTADQQLAEELVNHLDINVDEYARAMFDAKSDISKISNSDLLTLDSKVIEVHGQKIRISVIETTNVEPVLDRKLGIIDSINSYILKSNEDQLLFFVVDILQRQATLIINNEEIRLMSQQAFDVEITGDLITLPGIMSRKKQIIPALLK